MRMRGHTKIIKVDGSVVEQDWTTMPELEFWQEAVEGHIEMVPRWPTGVAFCNSDGKLEGKPYNVHAQRIWGYDPRIDHLVGNIVEVTGDREFMRQL